MGGLVESPTATQCHWGRAPHLTTAGALHGPPRTTRATRPGISRVPQRCRRDSRGTTFAGAGLTTIDGGAVTIGTAANDVANIANLEVRLWRFGKQDDPAPDAGGDARTPRCRTTCTPGGPQARHPPISRRSPAGEKARW